jgi:hypothetical protein
MLDNRKSVLSSVGHSAKDEDYDIPYCNEYLKYTIVNANNAISCDLSSVLLRNFLNL